MSISFFFKLDKLFGPFANYAENLQCTRFFVFLTLVPYRNPFKLFLTWRYAMFFTVVFYTKYSFFEHSLYTRPALCNLSDFINRRKLDPLNHVFKCSYYESFSARTHRRYGFTDRSIWFF